MNLLNLSKRNLFKNICFKSFSNTVKFNVLFLEDNVTKNVEIEEGKTFYNVIEKYEFPEMGLCGAQISCSTCHCIIPNSIYNGDDISYDEEDLLSTVDTKEDTSRLGCQVKIDKSFEGITIKVPKSSV